jgi:hypothetical protein
MVLDRHLLNSSAVPWSISPDHAHPDHSIKLLRQSLMSQPDLTIEGINKKTMRALGFGTEHVGVDLDQLVE